MQSRTPWVIIVILLLIIIGGVLYVRRHTPPSVPPDNSATSTNSTMGAEPTASSTVQNTNDTIEVTSPAPNSLVHSPLAISGRAKSPWYFEAQFPVELVDNDGNVIAQAPAQAQGDWMSPDFVPFTLSLSFQVPATTTTGLLIFKNDNPSGDPSRDIMFAIPVRFK